MTSAENCVSEPPKLREDTPDPLTGLLPSALAIMPPPPSPRYKNLTTALRRLVSRMVRLLHITFYTARQPLVLCGRYAFFVRQVYVSL